MSVEEQIIKKLKDNKRGKIFFPSNFFKIDSYEKIHVALGRLKKKQVLVRLAHGIYLYPKIDKELGVLYPPIDEIAKAMTTLSGNRYIFKADDIADCENRFSAGDGNPLGKLFSERLDYDYDLSKTELLKILFGFIISHQENEFDADDKAKRPVVQVIEKVIDLARKNYYRPVTLDIWQKNQESGYFGDPIE